MYTCFIKKNLTIISYVRLYRVVFIYSFIYGHVLVELVRFVMMSLHIDVISYMCLS